MPRKPQGLRPIGESVRKIVERIRKEREERQKKSSSPRTQPKLPGMKNGGGADASIPTIKELANAIKDTDVATKADFERARKKLSTQMGRTSARNFMNRRKDIERKKDSDDKVRASVREISARELKSGGLSNPAQRPDSRKKKKNPKGKGFERKFPGPARPGNPVEVYEVKKGALIGGQKKLDANKDGKISGEDFKILRGKKNKMRGGGIAIKGTNFKGVY